MKIKENEVLKKVEDFTKEKAVPTLKNATAKTKKAIVNTSSAVASKVKTTLTEKQMLEILDTLYTKSVNGIPKVSLPVEDLVNDYITKNDSIEKAAKSLINNSTIKCCTSGFITGLGGFTYTLVALPANITSVIYVQLRMCCAIAKMAGYDITSDQVQTLIYACLTGSGMVDIFKQAGIKFGKKYGTSLIEKIPGTTITTINRKVGFRFVTKYGKTGIVNLTKLVPVVGGVIGGGVDVASTKLIGYNAYKLFIKGEIPTKEEVEKELVKEVNVIEEKDVEEQQSEKEESPKNTIKDIDDKTLEQALKEQETLTSEAESV